MARLHAVLPATWCVPATRLMMMMMMMMMVPFCFFSIAAVLFQAHTL